MQSNWQIISRTVESALSGVSLADMRHRITPPGDRGPLNVVTIS